ncbi:MAG: AAA family ATPase [Clostridia bacterium]|nr:AAA family ATPase [Clostridia bacterium]
MRILKIEIEEFGKLRDLVLEPCEGLTLIEGENESGKSTLLAFLRFALYGFPRRGGADGDERDKRLSWGRRTAAGQLTLETAEDRFRIVRRAYLRGSAARETLAEELSVVRLSDGAAVALDGKSPGEYFLGLPPELYEGSLCMTQGSADRVAAPGVGEAMGEKLFIGEGAATAEEAAQRLALAHRDLRHLKGRGGRIVELEDRLAELERALAQGNADGLRLAELRTALEQCRTALQRDRQELSQVNAVLEGNEIDRTLALFDDKAAALTEEARCRAALEQAEGEMPRALLDRGFVERVAQLLRRYLDERARVARLAPEVEGLRAVKRDESVCEIAERIEELGGADAVLRTVEKKQGITKKSAVTGVVFLVFALVLGLVSKWMISLRLYAMIAAGGCGLFALVLLCVALGSSRSRKGLLHELNVPPKGRLRTYLEKVRNDAELMRSHGQRLERLQAELAGAQQSLSAVDLALCEELTAVDRADLCGSPEAITDFLAELSGDRGRRKEALAAATAALERARGVTEMLERRLQGIDEAALRDRRAALPAVSGDEESCRRRQSDLRRAVAAGEQKLLELQRDEAALAATACDPMVLARERDEVAARLTSAKRRLAAVQLAQEAMESATDEMRRSITPRLGKTAAEFFDSLTDGAHGALRISPEFAITLEEDGIPRPISHFSAGCLDAAHLALRLALLDAISSEPLPLLFDEALAQLDDHRAKSLLLAIVGYCRRGGQCLLFTCHSREARLLDYTPGVKLFSMPKA